jgi:hypothetical protein
MEDFRRELLMKGEKAVQGANARSPHDKAKPKRCDNAPSRARVIISSLISVTVDRGGIGGAPH